MFKNGRDKFISKFIDDLDTDCRNEVNCILCKAKILKTIATIHTQNVIEVEDSHKKYARSEL